MWLRLPAAATSTGWGTAEDILDRQGTFHVGAYMESHSPRESWLACQTESSSVSKERTVELLTFHPEGTVEIGKET